MVAGLALWLLVLPCGAIDPSNVLVLYNEDSPDSIQIADYYVGARPGVHLLSLSGVSQAEQVTADDYLNTIRPQVLDFLNGQSAPQIDVIVTTKGLPLRIDAGPAPNPNPSLNWQRYSSLESELTRVDSISTVDQMGDQYWSPFGLPTAQVNPYFNVSVGFDHTDPANDGIRLTSRLDGFSVQDVTEAIDRSWQVLVVADEHYWVLDDDPNALGSRYDKMPDLKNNVLEPQGQATVFDDANAAITSAPGPVIAYVSHGVNDGAGGLNRGYIENQLAFDLADGAIIHTWESFNAYSFQPGGNQYGQALIAEWLAEGGTAGVGNVHEPGASVFTVTNEDILFERSLAGLSFVEAAWSATWSLSYVNTVVGDPLMEFISWLPGDANFDGVVGTSDLNILMSHWGESVTPGDVTMAEFTGDGLVNGSDLDFLRGRWSAGTPPAIPEPASVTLLTLGALGLLVRRWRREPR